MWIRRELSRVFPLFFSLSSPKWVILVVELFLSKGNYPSRPPGKLENLLGAAGAPGMFHIPEISVEKQLWI